MGLQGEALLWMHAAAADGLRVILTQDESDPTDALLLSVGPDEYRRSRYPELAPLDAKAPAHSIDAAALGAGQMLREQIEAHDLWDALPHLAQFYEMAGYHWRQ